MFTDETYGNYSYVYAGYHDSESVGVQGGISGSVGGSFFVSYKSGDKPSRSGRFSRDCYVNSCQCRRKSDCGWGISVGGFKSGDWKGLSFGINISGGVGVNAGSVNVTGSRTWLINDVKPSADRRFVDRITNFANPILSAIVTGSIDKLKNI